jgi:hypothetical protein
MGSFILITPDLDMILDFTGDRNSSNTVPEERWLYVEIDSLYNFALRPYLSCVHNEVGSIRYIDV